MKPAPAGGLRQPSPIKLDDPAQEKSRRDLHAKIVELQQLPASSITIIPNVVLVDATPTTVAHGLGRPPVWIKESIIRGSASSGGYIVESRGSSNRSESVVITATGFAATITVDLMVL